MPDDRGEAVKVCNICGVEIARPDGVNICSQCEATCRYSFSPLRARPKLLKRIRETAYVAAGLKKARGVLGGEYWE